MTCEVLMAVKMSMIVFLHSNAIWTCWLIHMFWISLEDGDNMFSDDGIYLQAHMVLLLRRPTITHTE
jgi:hypothetical protein